MLHNDILVSVFCGEGFVLIELKNVKKTYGNFNAVDDISFKIEKGEIVGFLGQNGAGKTTTMNIITGILAPTSGEVIIDGEKFNKKSKSKIGYMPENTPLYESLTVREFLDFMAELKKVKRSERKNTVDEIIKKLSLNEVENKLIKNISRGYRQRASLGGAVIGNPEIIILDEPTVGLDPKQIVEIRNYIKSLKENHTILLSTHILSEVNQICDKVIIINKGKIIAEDTPTNLEKNLNNNIINIVVEDPKNNMESACKEIKEIIRINKVSQEDKEIKYKIEVKAKEDIRKKVFEVLPKYSVNVIELSKVDSTLEEVFMNFIKEEGDM